MNELILNFYLQSGCSKGGTSTLSLKFGLEISPNRTSKEDNRHHKNKLSRVYSHAALQMDLFPLFMTLPNTILPLTDAGQECKCLVYSQRARVLLSEIRQKNIGKVDEEGTYCLLGGIIKPGRKNPRFFWRSYPGDFISREHQLLYGAFLGKQQHIPFNN